MSYSYVDTIGRWGRGNIDLNARIPVLNPDDSISTERSFSTEIDGEKVLLPAIVDGQVLSESDAIDHYIATGEYLGKFSSVVEANEYAQMLHERQQWFYVERRPMSYNDVMGFVVNGFRLPDPSDFTYQVGDLDTSGNRDATGLLHRAYVATKINFELSWNSLEWEKLQQILAAVNTPKFTLTAPDPRSFLDTYTGDYYVGDRTGNMKYFLVNKDDVSQFSLKMKFIEY